ncbi:MFS transporter [Pseudomonas sp. GD03860]|uniref:MFS transporter n=2 Tax=Pseudomonas TaxID=286 RepID=UPI0023645DE1|nr:MULTISPECIES: MFS transporter [Pseudomonas]MDD2056726.1 MFS transporter [Pseudomonas putida]MDH0638080.1 MFS transporter [Pseudomonas sp. GD03860]
MGALQAPPLLPVASTSRRVPVIIGCALLMELIDATVVMTALPQMGVEFGVPSVRMNLVVSLYMLAAALAVPVSGWAADRFGPRRLFVLAMVLFTLSSLACAMAGSLLQLCLARLCQGAAGAMMVPVGMMILLRWSPREDLLRNMSYLTIPPLIGPMLGPPLGGLMVTLLSWQWIFLINLPIGVLGVWLVLRHIPDYPGASERPLDGRGLALSSVALGALVFGFEALGHGLLARPWVLVLLAVGVLAALLYVRHARRCAQPLLDFSPLRVRSFALSFWGGNLFRLGTAAQPFLMVLLFQLCFGLSPLQAGLLTFTGGVGAFVVKLLAVRIVRRLGFRRTLSLNALMTGLSLLACARFDLDTPYWLVVMVLFGSGLIRSLQFSAMGGLTYADVPAHLHSRASSLSAATVQLTMSLSVGIAASLLGALMSFKGEQQVGVADIATVIGGCALVCMASALVFRRLAPEAGRDVYL